MRWSVETDPLVMLHAKPQLVKNNYLTQQFHYNSERKVNSFLSYCLFVVGLQPSSSMSTGWVAPLKED